MRLIKSLIVIMMLGIAASCKLVESPTIYPVPESVADTDWSYSQIKEQQSLFYTLHFNETDTGSIVCYDAKSDGNLIKEEALTYSYKRPAISITFAERGRYDGYITEKGEILVNGTAAHIMQLYKVDNEGNPLYDAYGNFVEMLMFWQY